VPAAVTSGVPSMWVLRLLFAMQGAGYGAVDACSIVAISEMWGQRSAPWLQGKNLMSGGGAVIAPLLIGAYGYCVAFHVVGLFALIAWVGVLLENLWLTPMDTTWLSMCCIESYEQVTNSFTNYPYNPFYADELNYLQQSVLLIEEENPGKELEKVGREYENLVNEVLDNVDVHAGINGSDHPSLVGRTSRGGSISIDDPNFTRPRVNSTLAYAPPTVSEFVREHKDTNIGINIAPISASIMLACFSFLIIGLLYSYGAWISVYAIQRYIPGGNATGVHIATMFYMSQTIGSIVSVPLAVAFSSTSLLRCQMVILLVGAILLSAPLSLYTSTMVSACLVGYALSCMYPLVVALVNDYGCTMDSQSAIAIVMGGCLGESILPVLVGTLMATYGPSALDYYIFLTIAAMIVVYVVIHVYMTKFMASHALPKFDPTREPTQKMMELRELIQPIEPRIRGTSNASYRSFGSRDRSYSNASRDRGVSITSRDRGFSTSSQQHQQYQQGTTTGSSSGVNSNSIAAGTANANAASSAGASNPITELEPIREISRKYGAV